jgi:hypothetical protein
MGGIEFPEFLKRHQMQLLVVGTQARLPARHNTGRQWAPQE